MNQLKHQWELFLTAMSFFTRIPIPKSIAFSQDNLNRCNRYFPLVGVVIGGIGALVYWVAAIILPHSVAVILSMGATVIATGAFHEDGFADVCDAFGGGWTKEKILTIMKDSRVGAYGAIGIMLLLLLKYETLNHINPRYIVLSLMVGHTLSRSMAVWTMYSLDYVREDESSKSKPITKSVLASDTSIAAITGLLSLLLLGDIRVFLVIIPLLFAKWWIEKYFKKWIGGYTGDCLGTVQQVSEVVIYLFLLAFHTYIEQAKDTFILIKDLF